MTEQGQQTARPPMGLSKLFSEVFVVAAILLGIFLIWVSHLVIVSAGGTTASVMLAYKAYFVLTGLGEMISSGALIGGGILNKEIDKFVRFGMLLAAGLIIVEMLRFLSAIPSLVF